MITAYLSNGLVLQKYEVTVENSHILKEAIWVDMYTPSAEDERLVEITLGLNVPTREEMQEIEISSRLYREENVFYMTATMVAKSDTDLPQNDPVTFMLTERYLITVRYLEPQPFKEFLSHIYRLDVNEHAPIKLLIGLLEATINRIADILERIGHNLDKQTQNIFRQTVATNVKENKLDFQLTLREIGFNGDLNARSRESLLSFNRLLSYLSQADVSKLNHEGQARLRNLTKDIASLSDHATFLSNKVNFLLDATLGMLNIEQNNIIKIFSVAAVIFLPPTLIASIYGMNFQFMPELHWKLSYPIAVCLMLLSAWLPYRYFKHRKWL